MFIFLIMNACKKRIRFSDFDDLVVLREVLAHNPFENPDLYLQGDSRVFRTGIWLKLCRDVQLGLKIRSHKILDTTSQ